MPNLVLRVSKLLNTVCLVFTRAVYEEVISGSNALIEKDASDHVDLSKDHETLFIAARGIIWPSTMAEQVLASNKGPGIIWRRP